MQITIDTDKLLKWGAIVVVCLLVLGMCINYAYYKGKDDGGEQTTVTIYVPQTTPVPTATPTTVSALVQSSAYWTDTVIINGITTSSGFYQVTVQDGRSFNVPYSVYSMLHTSDKVIFHVTGSYYPYSWIVYYADDVRVVERSDSYRYYNDGVYYYHGRYYDRYTGNEVGWKDGRVYRD